MNNVIVFITSATITIFILFLIFFYVNLNAEGITGQIINEIPDEDNLHINRQNLDDYTYTKAICDNSNFCQDNLIKCDGNILISITPINGSEVKYDENWNDIRTKEEIETFCK